MNVSKINTKALHIAVPVDSQSNQTVLKNVLKKIFSIATKITPKVIIKRIMTKRFGHVGFELSNLCNANCTFCAYRFQERDKEKIGVNIYNKVLEEYVQQKGGGISFSPTVGDPLVDKDIVDKIKKASSQSEISQIALYTNGILLKKIGFLNLIKSGLTQLSISTYMGSQEGYKKYYGVDKYDLVMNNILEISRINAGLGFPVNISLHLRVDLDNEDWKKTTIFTQINKYITTKNISYLTEYDNWGGKIVQADLPVGAVIEEPIEFKEKIKSPCFELYRRMHILSNGNVGCCVCRDMEGEINIGNVEKQSILEIWNGKILSDLRKKWTKEGATPKVCEECTRYQSIDKYIENNKQSILLNYFKVGILSNFFKKKSKPSNLLEIDTV